MSICKSLKILTLIVSLTLGFKRALHDNRNAVSISFPVVRYWDCRTNDKTAVVRVFDCHFRAAVRVDEVVPNNAGFKHTDGGTGLFPARRQFGKVDIPQSAFIAALKIPDA